MNEQPKQKGGTALAERPSGESIIQQVGVEGVYQKMCKAFGTEEVGLAKLTCAPTMSDKDFIHGMWLAHQNGVNPLKRECFFYMANSKHGGKTLVFMVAIPAFRARAKKSGMTVIQARAVCDGDDFEWDHVKGQPLRHVSPKKDRGRVVSGWGRIKTAVMEEPTAIFKDAKEWLDDASSHKPSQFHLDMGQHMMEITIERQMIQMVCPDVFPGAYTPEDFGGRVVGGELSMDPDKEPRGHDEEESGPLTMDERELMVKDLPIFLDRLGIKRQAARWAKLDKVLGRRITGRNPRNLTDWDLRKVHDALREESLAPGTEVIVPEIVEPGDGAGAEAAADKDAPAKPEPEEKPKAVKDPCETCKGEIEEWWGVQLTRFRATKRECRPCYYRPGGPGDQGKQKAGEGGDAA
jgi:hypothetical protein